MSYGLDYSKNFKKSLKRLKYSGSFNFEELETVVDLLKSDGELPALYKDHSLKGEYADCRECHIRGDLLLMYKINHQIKVIVLVDIGSHSQLFG